MMNINASFEKLFESFPSELKENEQFLQEVISCAEVITLQKGAYLLKAGSICSSGYFVNRGSFLHLYVNEKGAKAVMGLSADLLYPFFSSPSYFLCDQTGFELKAIEEAEVLAFPREKINALSQKYPAFDSYFKELMLMVIAKIYMITAMRQSNTPEEILRYIYKEQIWIVNRVPDKYIAQFIGISNEWYCKLKKRILPSL